MDPLTILSNLVVRLLGDRLTARDGVRRKLPWSSTRKISGRAREIVERASAGQCPVESTVAYVCGRVPNLPLSKLEGFISGAVEVSSDQAKQICDVLGASFGYLWRGDGAPFGKGDEFPVGVGEYLPLFREDGVEEVIFVRGNKIPHASYAVLKYGEFDYRVLPDLWHVSSVNGGGGASSLCELARLSENIHRTTTYRVVVRGIEVPSKIADGVFYGHMHPRSLWSKGWKSSHWWDDIADVDHQRACAPKYSSLGKTGVRVDFPQWPPSRHAPRRA